MRTIAACALLVAVAGCCAPCRMAPSNQFGGLEFEMPQGRGQFGNPEFDLRAQTFHTIIIARDSTPPARQDDPRGGELRTIRDGRDVALPLKHTDVKAQVSILIGSVTVTQQYHNPYDGKIEAVYVFPLPENGAVRDFVMTIGGRTIRGIIREREEAERIYREARRQGHVASLLTQERANIFTQSVANIEPGRQIDVSITYFHAMKYAEGEFEFWFPMVVGPRYTPPGYRKTVPVEYLRPDEISSHDVALEVEIDAGAPIGDPASPSHAIRVERPSEAKAKVTLSPNDRIPNKDFVLRWRTKDRGLHAALATQRDEKEGYFTLVLQPPPTLADTLRQPREMVFVIDLSGSMSGEPLAIAQRAAIRCLRRLEPNDTFQILWFSDDVGSMTSRPLPATPDNVRRGVRTVEGLTSHGGTQMTKPILAALDMPADLERYRIVSFMTDGFIGNDREILGIVKKHLGNSRIFSFGIGSSVNRFLIEGMARVGRGTAAFVGLDESSERAVDLLYQRVERPAMCDIRIDWGGLSVSDVSPSPLPDLFVGRPVIVAGRFSGRGKATVRVTGTVGGKRAEVAIDVDTDAGVRHKALPAVWARARIEDLSDEATYSPAAAEIAGQVKALALKHGLVSQFTAFVAVDASRRTEGAEGTTVPVPIPVPKGTKYETTVPEK